LTVSTRTLERIAGATWIAVGVMLAYRGAGLLERGRLEQDATQVAVVLSIAIGLVIGCLKGWYVLRRTANRNIRRIRKLSAPKPWNVFSGTFVILILAMIGLGQLLKLGAGNGWFGGFAGVSGIYFGIGAGLIVASLAYFLPRAPAMPTRRESAAPSGDAPIGVLLVNLGTPEAPTTPAVRRYLREFLSDPFVVEANRAVWAFVLNVIILPFRSGASAALYQKVWTPQGSPLLLNSQRLQSAVAARLGSGYRTVLAMRYGAPSLTAALDEFEAAGCEHVIVLPLFPQTSRTTTGTIHARLARLASRRRNAPTFAAVPSWATNEGYIAALAERIRETQGSDPVDHYVFSFHGLPEAYVKQGDPYLDQCTATAFALAEKLGLARAHWDIVFQSRFGDEPWLQPYADEFVPALAPTKPRVLVSTPGFAADCLETIEEIGLRLREDFLAAGGEELIVTPALNDHPLWVNAAVTLVRSTSIKGDDFALGVPVARRQHQS
jgi:ferrochelatase